MADGASMHCPRTDKENVTHGLSLFEPGTLEIVAFSAYGEY